MNRSKYRALEFPVTRVILREGPGAVRYMKAEQPLQEHAPRLTDRLVHWAHAAPDRTFIARRARNADGTTGEWRHISYQEALDSARRIGQALIDRGLSAERPLVILSENDLEHALLALGCIYAGVPYCPVSPAYSTISQDHGKLRHVLGTLTPGLVFAADAQRYGKAIEATVGAEVEVVLANGTLQGRPQATQCRPSSCAATRSTSRWPTERCQGARRPPSQPFSQHRRLAPWTPPCRPPDRTPS